jgi:hypothetical protein
MKTINSLSGGKTSSYMAYHYPADYNIFALVTIDDIKCTPKDKSIIKYVSDKLNKDFIATAEDDLTLYAMRDLEQLIGRQIIWVSGYSFDKIITHKKGYLPCSFTRYCTTEMKLRPIWDWWFNNINQKIRMAIGYRYDEKERAERFTTSFKGIVGKSGLKNKWEEIEWREGYFPLIENKIFHIDVKKWSDKSGILFPSDSNCVGCFHKSLQQLRKNFEDNPEKMNWFVEQENKTKNKFKKEIKYENIKKIGLQSDFIFGEGSGCQGGFCTD